MKERQAWKQRIKKIGFKLFVLCFWLLLWELISRQDTHEIYLVSPGSCLRTLIHLIITLDFWRTVASSSLRIISGFILALIAGILLAAAAFNNRLIQELISPIMKIMKAIPVASFIILALLWLNSKTNLSVLIPFMMVLPLIYTNVLQGLRSADEKLLQMAQVYRLSRVKKVQAIYIPAVLPYLISTISFGVGFCWKAGIAAEVIGIPSGSIGERLYEAKLYLMTGELFAWTLVIIVISMLFEKTVLYFLKLLQRDLIKSNESIQF